MRRFSHCLLASAAALVPFHSTVQAAVFSRDWKAPGDGLLTYDDVNQREWLDLTESRLSMFAGTTFEQRFQNALLQLGPGGIYSGFHAAQSSDALALAQSAGIDTSTFAFSINDAATEGLINLVGVSQLLNMGGAASYGLLDEHSAPPQFPVNVRLTVELFVNPDTGPDGLAGIYIAPGNRDGLASPNNTGIWLFRPIPEPCSSFICAVCMTVVARVNRRRLSS